MARECRALATGSDGRFKPLPAWWEKSTSLPLTLLRDVKGEQARFGKASASSSLVSRVYRHCR